MNAEQSRQPLSKRVLLYYVPNKRSIYIETVAKEISKTGNTLIFLTQTPRGDLHAQLDKLGVENYSKVFGGSSMLGYIRHCLYLISFCRKHKIDVVWSH